MNINEKYGIVYINNKRYYEFDMSNELPFLDETVPYMFKYKNIEIIESSWSKMTVKILEQIDLLNPKTEYELLSIHYYWSKQDVFSTTKKANFSEFKNLFLNTNHTSSHAMMSIQCLLKAYNINLNECYFLIRRHFIYEPQEVKQIIRSNTIDGFKLALSLKSIEDKKIAAIVKNFEVINKYLSKASSGYDDFFLFDDYASFTNYKIRTLNELKKRVLPSNKNYKIIVLCLNYLDDFYKNRSFYEWLKSNKIEDSFLDCLKTEINNLFVSLKTDIIACNKVYSRMCLLYKEEMLKLGVMNNSKSLFIIITVFLSSDFYFKNPFISSHPITNITNYQIILSYANSLERFTITEINLYIEKMHLKKLSNYMEFINDSSTEFVQIGIESMVSVDSFPITDLQLKKIKDELNYYIESFGNIRSEKYNDYDSLPKLSFEWNTYMLVGIIRTYLNDWFSVETIGTNYKNATYLIKKKQQ